jgi:hypothetical protein
VSRGYLPLSLESKWRKVQENQVLLRSIPKVQFWYTHDSRASCRQVDFHRKAPNRELQNTASDDVNNYRKNSCLNVVSSAFYESANKLQHWQFCTEQQFCSTFAAKSGNEGT